ncbi:MAG: ATP-binding protein [Promethearchaeia archaeon]
MRIELINNGIGIPDNKKQYIFQRISKESVIGRDLGLSLVKNIIEVFGGKTIKREVISPCCFPNQWFNYALKGFLICGRNIARISDGYIIFN